ncbi:MAG: hypothetical protein PHS41_10200 [Victivallaceae bacterium]|nr:hypothetical protein [Victivallaceae bacterium]
MIKVAEPTLFVLDRSGDQVVFSIDELENRLRLCLNNSAESANLALAEDIAVAMEYSLTEAAAVNRYFSEVELDEAVVRILVNARCPESAKRYQNEFLPEYANKVSADFITLSAIADSIGISDREPCRRAAEALDKLKITEAGRPLLMELLRYFRDECPSSPANSVHMTLPVTADAVRGDLLISRADLLALLPEPERAFFTRGILEVRDVRRLFPRLHIAANLCTLAAFYRIERPALEMALAPALGRLGDVLATATAIWSAEARKRKPGCANALPVYLSSRETGRFMREVISAAWPESIASAREIWKTVFDAASFVPRKLILPVDEE